MKAVELLKENLCLCQLTGLFQFTVRLASETEARFTSVERIHHYIQVLQAVSSINWEKLLEATLNSGWGLSLFPRRPQPGSKVALRRLTGPSRGSWCSEMWR